MDKARIYVDFNEMVDSDIVLLSKEDMKMDSAGKQIIFYEGMPVSIYSDDEVGNKPDNLLADGIAIKNNFSDYSFWSHVKWCCKINRDGIYHESDMYIAAHKFCTKHKNEVVNDEKCGCFYCCKVFEPREIIFWLKEGSGTAICPYCGIDSVIGESSGYPISEKFLRKMNDYWF